MDFFKNILIKLRATGAAAVLIVMMLCVTAIAIFAPENANTKAAWMFFGMAAGSILLGLVAKIRK